jgi:hypothetical protein
MINFIKLGDSYRYLLIKRTSLDRQQEGRTSLHITTAYNTILLLSWRDCCLAWSQSNAAWMQARYIALFILAVKHPLKVSSESSRFEIYLKKINTEVTDFRSIKLNAKLWRTFKSRNHVSVQLHIDIYIISKTRRTS